MDTASVVFILFSSALVLFMTPDWHSFTEVWVEEKMSLIR